MSSIAHAARRVPILKTLAAFLVVNLVATGFLLHSQAGAAEQETVKVSETKTFAKTYGPIPLQNPVLPTAVADPEPGDCELPVAYCDVIPVEVELPADYDPELTYLYTTVELNWLQPPDTNDLDMYFWKLDDEGHYEEAGGSATGAQPERASTEAHKFFVVVNNFSGANDGYSLNVKVTVERLGEKPFELLEPEAAPLDLSGGDAGGGPSPLAPSADPGPSFSAPTQNTVTAAGPTAVTPSVSSPTAPDFAGTATAPALADVDFAPKGKAKNAIVGEGAFGSGPRAVAPETFAPASSSKPVPTSVLVLWLAVLPIVLVLLAGVWLARRGTARLAVG